MEDNIDNLSLFPLKTLTCVECGIFHTENICLLYLIKHNCFLLVIINVLLQLQGSLFIDWSWINFIQLKQMHLRCCTLTMVSMINNDVSYMKVCILNKGYFAWREIYISFNKTVRKEKGFLNLYRFYLSIHKNL